MGFKQMFLLCLVFIFICLHSATIAELHDDSLTPACTNIGGCELHRQECHEKCGCERVIKYDEATDECVIDYMFLRLLVDNYNAQGGFKTESHFAFRGIIISAIIFVTCVSICVLTVCIYCCRIHYSDRKLEKNVKALAKKLKIDYPKDSVPMGPVKPRNPVAESCNVVVTDANVMCV